MTSNIFRDPRLLSFVRSYQLDFEAGTFKGAYLALQEDVRLVSDHVKCELKDNYAQTCRTLIQQANDLPLNGLRDSDGYISLNDRSWKARLYSRAQRDDALSRLLFEKVETPDYQKTSLLFLEEPPVTQIVFCQENRRGVVRQTAIFDQHGDFFYRTFVSLYPAGNSFFHRWELKLAELSAELYIHELKSENLNVATPSFEEAKNGSDEISGGLLRSNTQLPIPDLSQPGKISYAPFFTIEFLFANGALSYLNILITSTKPIRVQSDLWTEILNYIQENNQNYGSVGT